MTKKAETKITRPHIFSECQECSVANVRINQWLRFDPLLPYVSRKTESVTIECEKKNGYVLLLQKSLVKVRFRKEHKMIAIEGGNIHPEIVACPHFTNLMTHPASPESETE